MMRLTSKANSDWVPGCNAVTVGHCGGQQAWSTLNLCSADASHRLLPAL